MDLDNLNSDIAILGIPFGMPYESQAMANDQSRASDAIRQFTNALDTWWFDLASDTKADSGVRRQRQGVRYGSG